MPYGSVGNGGGGPGLSKPLNLETSARFQKTETVSYGTSSQLYNLSSRADDEAPSGTVPKMIELANNGAVPLIVMVGYKSYSNETTIADSGATRYFHTMLMPGEIYYPSIRGAISTATGTTTFDGTSVQNQTPNANMYADISTVSSGFDNTTDPVTITSADGDFWRVGDMVRCNAEVVEITEISSANLTVKRGMLGTDAASHSDSETLRLQFSNDYHDISKYSVSQTDNMGRYKSSNFFGLGRTASGPAGIVPGSVAVKFYTEGAYQELGLTGITSGSHSGLTASTAYAFDIQVDGGTNFDNLTFTTDTTNLNFGGTNGIINKIQDALNVQFYTAGNLFEKRVTVSIVGGDLRFTSNSNLSTSAIALTAEDGSDASFFGTGRIPAVGSIDAAVPASVPDDNIYDRVTYATSPTNSFCYDDGHGNIRGMCNGTINYETGGWNITGAPPDAEMLYTVSHTSVFSGKLTDATTSRGGALTDILVNNPCQKVSGSIRARIN